MSLLNTVIVPRQLAEALDNHHENALPGLEELLSAALQLSVTQDEGRLPKLRICSSYTSRNPAFIRVDCPLDSLAAIAPIVPYPEYALLCIWEDQWKLAGVTKSIFPVDGVKLDIIAPLTLSITPPGQMMPTVQCVKGEIRLETQDWEQYLIQMSTDNPSVGGNAHILARAIFKTSIAGHGGAFIVLPDKSAAAMRDIEVRFVARAAAFFNLPRPESGQLRYDFVEQCSDSLAGLTRVDGAVILNRSLSLVGFGATLISRSRKRSSSAKGHRHRSAQAFCAKHLGAIGFVVSQDGPISAYPGPVVGQW